MGRSDDWHGDHRQQRRVRQPEAPVHDGPADRRPHRGIAVHDRRERRPAVDDDRQAARRCSGPRCSNPIASTTSASAPRPGRATARSCGRSAAAPPRRASSPSSARSAFAQATARQVTSVTQPRFRTARASRAARARHFLSGRQFVSLLAAAASAEDAHICTRMPVPLQPAVVWRQSCNSGAPGGSCCGSECSSGEAQVAVRLCGDGVGHIHARICHRRRVFVVRHRARGGSADATDDADAARSGARRDRAQRERRGRASRIVSRAAVHRRIPVAAVVVRIARSSSRSRRSRRR